MTSWILYITAGSGGALSFLKILGSLSRLFKIEWFTGCLFLPLSLLKININAAYVLCPCSLRYHTASYIYPRCLASPTISSSSFPLFEIELTTTMSIISVSQNGNKSTVCSGAFSFLNILNYFSSFQNTTRWQNV